MDKPHIIVVDDQRDVLTTVLKDLEGFSDYFKMDECESAEEAKELLDEIDGEGEAAALIVCDHIMPDQNGVDFLIELNNDSRFRHTRKLLLTGLATHKDTITAINAARIDRYIEKPWDKEALIGVVKVLLTNFLLDAGLDYQPYLPVLDQPTLYQELRRTT